jgi:arylsulfatase A-like enzyme
MPHESSPPCHVRPPVLGRRLHAAIALCVISGLIGACSHAVKPADEQRLTAPAGEARPNVLFIAVDDLNDWTNDLGGYPGVKTPNLDRLAERGVLFTRAYCNAPACNPSRTSLLTGIRPSTSGVYHNNQPWRPVMPDAVTLPQHFMAHGYHVVGGGKIFHGPYNDLASWHDYFKQPNDPMPPNRPLNGIPKTGHFDWGPLDESDNAMGDWKVTDWAIDYLDHQHDRPFFLGVGIFRPHLPWYVPRKYFDRYPLADIVLPEVKDDDLDDVPPIGRKMARPHRDHRRVLESHNWEKAVQGYLASITFADTCVGRVLDALDASPYADNTIIVLWSDHGWHLGEKLHWRKFALWEEATRMPIIIATPHMRTAGARCDRTVSLIDLYPTLIELCALPGRAELEGTSLARLLDDPSTPWDRPAVTTYGRQNHAVRSERWRYIRYSDGTEELYDHDCDPMEWTNLADDPRYADVKNDLAAWLPKHDAAAAPNDPNHAREWQKRPKARSGK